MSPSTYHAQPNPFGADSLSYVSQRALDVDYRTAVYREARMRQAEEIARVIHLITQAVARPVRALWAHFQAWRSYRAAYEELASLSERELADIGLTKADIDQVAHGDWRPAGREDRPMVRPTSTPVDLIHHNTPKLAA